MNNFISLIEKLRKLNPDEIGKFAFEEAMKMIEAPQKSLISSLAERIYTHPNFLSDVSYHNHHHAAEATLSAAFLLAHEYDSANQEDKNKLKRYGPYLIIAMLAHDFGHPGRTNASFRELEWGSVHLLEEVVDNLKEDLLSENKVQSAQALDEMMPILREIIIYTEFSQGPKENYKAYFSSINLPNDLDKLRTLANEADVLCSMLADTGPERGRFLAEEWSNKNAGTYKGRLGFLKFLEQQNYYSTSASEKLNLKAYLSNQIKAIESLDVNYLDSLEISQADQLVVNKLKEYSINNNNKKDWSEKLSLIKHQKINTKID